MKIVKMSLVAAMVMGANVFAIDNIKVSGDAKLFYGTDDQGNAGLLDQASSYADTALRLGVTGDLVKGVSFGATVNAVSTLGLENNLVANTWTGAHDAVVEDAGWTSELWIAAAMGKTTAKIGRMQLDTPLAFSETWSVAANTFDAVVLINQDLPDTTLVGAWVGKSNGVDAANASASSADRDYIMRDGAKFGTFAVDGAYAVAVVNNSLKFLTAQAWYYNVVNVADAYWLQADWDCQLVKGAKVGAQYANLSPKGAGVGVATTTNDSEAAAVKVAYNAIANLSVSAAYSKVNTSGSALKVANVATGSAQSKLYTESFWTYGKVSASGADSINVTAEYTVENMAKFGAYYTNVDGVVAAGDLSELALTASKTFGPLDATLALVTTDDGALSEKFNSVQAYLTLNF